MQLCDMPPRFAPRGICHESLYKIRIVLYHTPVRKINIRRMCNFRFRQSGESLWFSFRQLNFILAIRKSRSRSVSANPAYVYNHVSSILNTDYGTAWRREQHTACSEECCWLLTICIIWFLYCYLSAVIHRPLSVIGCNIIIIVCGYSLQPV